MKGVKVERIQWLITQKQTNRAYWHNDCTIRRTTEEINLINLFGQGITAMKKRKRKKKKKSPTDFLGYMIQIRF